MINMDEYNDYKVILFNSYTKESVVGLLNGSGFGYGTSASYESASLASALQAGVSGFVENAADRAGLGGALRMGKTAMGTTLASTYQSYDVTNPVNLNNISFHVFNSGSGYSQVLRALHNLTQPEIVKGIMKSRLYAKDHVFSNLKSEDGLSLMNDPFKGQLIHLHIGSWFNMTGLLCTGVTHSFSKNVDKSGRPAYMEVSVSLQPYKVHTTEEMLSWHGGGVR